MFRKEFNLSDYPEGVLVSDTKEEQGNEIFCGLHCTLEYIRKQQVESTKKRDCGLRAAAIGERDETDKDIEEGRVNIVFGSAEQW